MTGLQQRSGGARRVLVWDLPTRLFHWLLVVSVGFALVTGLLGSKAWVGPHMIAGYAVTGLLLFRAVWAFHGSHYSRLATFLYPPRRTLQHFSSLLKGRPAHYIGHNPSGGAMILALFGVLCLLVATGFLVQGGVEKQGPFAWLVAYGVGMTTRGVHKLLALLLLAMIIAHLAGVLAGSWLFKERLVSAMVDGHKRTHERPSAPVSARPGTALLWLAGLGGVAALGLLALSYLPALGMPAIPASQAMVSECGSCHRPFHPSLLPRAAWAALMGDLGHHFGEDASLPPARRDEIAAYLERYAAEAWDSKAAHRFSVLSPQNPTSITATPAWQRLHRSIDPAIFRSREVGAMSNCAACHGDADSGRFDPQAIAIPEGAEP